MTQISDNTKAIFRELRTAASEPRLVTYGELAEATGINPRSVGVHLTTIHARLRDKSPGLPWLVAIAVTSDTRTASFLALAAFALLPGTVAAQNFDRFPGFAVAAQADQVNVTGSVLARLDDGACAFGPEILVEQAQRAPCS